MFVAVCRLSLLPALAWDLVLALGEKIDAGPKTPCDHDFDHSHAKLKTHLSRNSVINTFDREGKIIIPAFLAKIRAVAMKQECTAVFVAPDAVLFSASCKPARSAKAYVHLQDRLRISITRINIRSLHKLSVPRISPGLMYARLDRNAPGWTTPVKIASNPDVPRPRSTVYHVAFSTQFQSHEAHSKLIVKSHLKPLPGYMHSRTTDGARFLVHGCMTPCILRCDIKSFQHYFFYIFLLVPQALALNPNLSYFLIVVLIVSQMLYINLETGLSYSTWRMILRF